MNGVYATERRARRAKPRAIERRTPYEQGRERPNNPVPRQRRVLAVQNPHGSPNRFGENARHLAGRQSAMYSIEGVFDRTDAPADRPREHLDVRDMGPPNPLAKTLELLPELDDDVVLVQRNDRAPQFLFPKLEDRGYVHESVEREDDVITLIWRDE